MQANPPEITFPPLPACWLTAPDERSPEFLPAFARISLAVQTALRLRVPAAYFERLENYRDLKRAYPMLIYQASRPFRARVRTELTYDVLNPEATARVLRRAKPALIELLGQTENRLRAAGCHDVAHFYRPKLVAEIIESVQRLSKSRRCLYILIRVESVLMNALIDLSGFGALRPKEQVRRTTTFEKRWSFQLRRFYPGTDYLWLAPALLDAASEALQSFQSAQPELEESLETTEPGPV